MEKKTHYHNEPTTKITGYWGHEPIWRELTPREKLEQFIRNRKGMPETVAKGLRFIADCMDKKANNIYPQ